MKRSKIWSPFKIIFTIIIIVTIIYSFMVISNRTYSSKYSGNENKLVGYINEIKVDGNKIIINLIAKEKIIISYYISSKREKDYILNNYQLGDYIKVKGKIEKPPKNRVFNLFNYNNYLLSQKIYWLFKADNLDKIGENNRVLYKFKNIIIKRINKVNGSTAYLKAFILGDTIDIENDILLSYQKNGINHLLAISGMHITLLSGIILKILDNFSKYKKTNYIITILFLFCYLFIINFSPSAIRATLLFLLLTVNKIMKLKISTIYYLILIFCLLLLYNPFYIYNVGFVFSFTISFYLILFQQIINNYSNYILKILIVSLIAFLVSIPILINNFYQINILSPIINVIFVPFVSLIIFPLSLLVFIFPFLDCILLFFLNILEVLSKFLSNINLGIIILKKIPLFLILFYYLVITFILICWKNKNYYSFILIVIILIIHTNSAYFSKYPRITLIDVGQGDSILIELPHNKGNILIDTGGEIKYKKEKWKKTKKDFSIGSNVIIPYLKSIGIKELKYLIITHGDNDHLGEAYNIISNYSVKNVIFNSGHNNKAEKKIINLLNNKNINYYYFNKNIITIDHYKFYFLNIGNKENENEDSLIIYTQLNNKNILLMGDAGKKTEGKIINEYKLSKMDILKIGHHGSRNSTSDELLDIVKPNLALISAGINNRFNHPNKEVIEKLEKRKIKHYITSINGTIKLILKKEIVIYTCL